MEAIEFREQNLVLKKPDSMTDEECHSLNVHRTEKGQIISCWKLSPEDLEKINKTGVVWLSVWSGMTAPPVGVYVDRPFLDEVETVE